MRTSAWEKNMWWWDRCNDLDFYEKLQEHMDICNKLKVIPASSIKWGSLLDAWNAMAERPLVAGGLAIVVTAGVTSALPWRKPRTRYDRINRPYF